MIRILLSIILLVLVIGVVLYAFGVIDVRQTQEAHLPEVRTEGGQLPATWTPQMLMWARGTRP